MAALSRTTTSDLIAPCRRAVAAPVRCSGRRANAPRGLPASAYVRRFSTAWAL